MINGNTKNSSREIARAPVSTAATVPCVQCDLTGVNESLLSRYENGKLEPPPKIELIMARKLGVRIADLFPIAREESR